MPYTEFGIINQQIFDYSVDLILVTDRDGVFLRVSRSSNAILGYKPSEMVGRNAVDFLHPDDQEAARAMMRAARTNGGITRHFECRYVHKDGHVRTLVWAGAWVPSIERHFFIGRDVTDRRVSETFSEIAKAIANMSAQIEVIHQTLDDSSAPLDPARDRPAPDLR